jgi:hypothetical protein
MLLLGKGRIWSPGGSDLREWLFHSHMGSGSGETNFSGVGSGVGAKNISGVTSKNYVNTTLEGIHGKGASKWKIESKSNMTVGNP